MITDPIVKYWGHGILSPTMRGFSHSDRLRVALAQRAEPTPFNHGSTDRFGPRAYTRSDMIGFRISLTHSLTVHHDH